MQPGKPPVLAFSLHPPTPTHTLPPVRPSPTPTPTHHSLPPMALFPCSTAGQREYSSPNTLLALRGKAGRFMELKSLSLSRVRPFQLAVGAGDQYVRLYDRRMAGTGVWHRAGAVEGVWSACCVCVVV